MTTVDTAMTRGMTRTQRWTLALTSVGTFMVALDALVVATALSAIRLHLSASVEELEWTVNAYTLTFAVLLLAGAALGDRYGRKRMFIAGLLLFAAASALCALAPNIGWLIAARAIQGGGAALVAPLSVTLLSEAFPPQQRGRAMGAFSGVAGLAVLSGPVVGGAIVQGIAWQWIFWLNVPIGLIAIPLILWRIPESHGPRAQLDYVGVALATGGALGIIWGLVRGNNAGWGSIEVVAALTAGIALAIGFVLYEARARAPMLPMRLFRSRAFAAGNAAAFLFFASLYGSAFFIAQFFQTAQGMSPLAAGLRLAPWTSVLFLAAPITGALINRVGERIIIICALLLQGAAMLWIGLIASPSIAYPALIAPLVIAGVGSAAIPSGQNVVINAVEKGSIGKASGAFNMLRQLGAAFGVAILAALFSAGGSFHTAHTFTTGFTAAMSASAALCFTGALCGLLLPSKRAAAVPTPVNVGPERIPQAAAS